jgi:hypothetical protein
MLQVIGSGRLGNDVLPILARKPCGGPSYWISQLLRLKHLPVVSCIKNTRIRDYNAENQAESRSKYCETFNSF